MHPWLNYHHLLYFWLAVREGGVSAAARRLGLAQPTVSAQIRALEGSLGVKLLERRGRGSVPTEAGRVVLRYADQIFTLGQELRAALEGEAAGPAPPLVVGVADVLPKLVVYRLLEPVLALPEPVRIVCREDTEERLLGQLTSHELDLVLADAPISHGTPVRAYNHLLGESGTTFFAAAPLASRLRRGFPESLDGAPLLLPLEPCVARRSLDAWLEARSLRPRIVGEFEDRALLAAFAAAGAGVLAAPTAIEREVQAQYKLRVVGRAEDLRERFYAISIERRVKHPAVLAVSAAARELLVG